MIRFMLWFWRSFLRLRRLRPAAAVEILARMAALGGLASDEEDSFARGVFVAHALVFRGAPDIALRVVAVDQRVVDGARRLCIRKKMIGFLDPVIALEVLDRIEQRRFAHFLDADMRGRRVIAEMIERDLQIMNVLGEMFAVAAQGRGKLKFVINPHGKLQ